MLTGNEIKIQIESGNIGIYPYDENCIGPNSYDVRLGDQLMVYREAVLDARRENRTRVIDIPEEGLVLLPGKLYLGKTVEWTSSPWYVPMYEGRSSLGRLGISSHITAGFGDIGFEGELDPGDQRGAAGEDLPRYADRPALLAQAGGRDRQHLSREVPGAGGYPAQQAV